MKLYVQRNDELYHYGVPGMKWGHRKAPIDVNDPRYSSQQQSVAPSIKPKAITSSVPSKHTKSDVQNVDQESSTTTPVKDARKKVKVGAKTAKFVLGNIGMRVIGLLAARKMNENGKEKEAYGLAAATLIGTNVAASIFHDKIKQDARNNREIDREDRRIRREMKEREREMDR